MHADTPDILPCRSCGRDPDAIIGLGQGEILNYALHCCDSGQQAFFALPREASAAWNRWNGGAA